MFLLSMRCVFMCRSRNGKTDMKQVRETRIWGNLCRQKRRQQAQVRQVQWLRRKVQLHEIRFVQFVGTRRITKLEEGHVRRKSDLYNWGNEISWHLQRREKHRKANLWVRHCKVVVGWELRSGSCQAKSAYLWTRFIPLCDVLGTEVQTHGVGDKFILIIVNTSASINDAMNTVHLPRTTSSHAQLLRSLVAVLLSWCTVAHWSHAFAWLKSRSTVSAFRPKTLTFHLCRAMSHFFFILISHPASWTILRRSTATTEWRFDGTILFCRSWAKFVCWRPWWQALHRRRPVHWKRGFPCQTLVLPFVHDGVNIWFSGKHRDATGIGLRGGAISCSAVFTTVFTGARSNCRTITSLSFRTSKIWCPVHLKIR